MGGWGELYQVLFWIVGIFLFCKSPKWPMVAASSGVTEMLLKKKVHLYGSACL